MRRSIHRLATAMLLLTPCVGRAQERPPAPTEQAVREIVDSTTAILERMYADADTGRTIANHIRRRHAAGAYRDARDWQHLSRALTQDLQSVNGDTHLWVEPGPAIAPAGPGVNTALHGVERVERLAGNVGYMAMSGFLGGESALRAVEAALWQLASTDAIILDLRNSRGGSAGLANFIISHFVPGDTVHSLTVYFRPQNLTTQRYTLAEVPGPRRPDVPLYVLTDDVTRSAAEDVPFVLQNLRRATIVGSRTAGAGRNNTFVELPYGLGVSVSISRVMEPGTRREWERIGVRPDVEIDADSALPAAHRLALDTLIAMAEAPARRRGLELVREVVVASHRAAAVPVATLRQYVGTYEGGQRVTVDEGALTYQPRVAQPRVRLVPLSPTRFGDGATRYEFVASPSGPTLRIILADGSATTYARTSRTIAPRAP